MKNERSELISSIGALCMEFFNLFTKNIKLVNDSIKKWEENSFQQKPH